MARLEWQPPFSTCQTLCAVAGLTPLTTSSSGVSAPPSITEQWHCSSDSASITTMTFLTNLTNLTKKSPNRYHLTPRPNRPNDSCASASSAAVVRSSLKLRADAHSPTCFTFPTLPQNRTEPTPHPPATHAAHTYLRDGGVSHCSPTGPVNCCDPTPSASPFNHPSFVGAPARESRRAPGFRLALFRRVRPYERCYMPRAFGKHCGGGRGGGKLRPSKKRNSSLSPDWGASLRCKFASYLR